MPNPFPRFPLEIKLFHEVPKFLILEDLNDLDCYKHLKIITILLSFHFLRCQVLEYSLRVHRNHFNFNKLNNYHFHGNFPHFHLHFLLPHLIRSFLLLNQY